MLYYSQSKSWTGGKGWKPPTSQKVCVFEGLKCFVFEISVFIDGSPILVLLCMAELIVNCSCQRSFLLISTLVHLSNNPLTGVTSITFKGVVINKLDKYLRRTRKRSDSWYHHQCTLHLHGWVVYSQYSAHSLVRIMQVSISSASHFR